MWYRSAGPSKLPHSRRCLDTGFFKSTKVPRTPSDLIHASQNSKPVETMAGTWRKYGSLLKIVWKQRRACSYWKYVQLLIEIMFFSNQQNLFLLSRYKVRGWPNYLSVKHKTGKQRLKDWLAILNWPETSSVIGYHLNEYVFVFLLYNFGISFATDSGGK